MARGVGHKVLSLKKDLFLVPAPGNCAKFATLLAVPRPAEIRRFLPSFLLGTPENVLAVQTLVVSLMDSSVNSERDTAFSHPVVTVVPNE